MANTTTFLNLLLPQNGEYVDSWDQPTNENFTKIDAWATGVDKEISDARFNEISLKNFLSLSHNDDGTLKPTEEMVKSRSSYAYGDENLDGSDFDLAQRLFQGDKEVVAAREGYSDLRSSNAFRSFSAGMVMDGLKDSNGYPAWMGFTGANIQIDGSTTNVVFMIGGLLARSRKLEQLTVSGVVGVKKLYAMYNSSGVVIVDGDATTAPPAASTGTIGSDGLKVRVFEDLTVNFTTSGVKPGDVLEVLGTGLNAGLYRIKTVAPSSNNNRLIIEGVFPNGSQAGLNYTITDSFAVTFGFDDVQTPVTGKLYIGEADFDGAAVSAIRPMHFQDMFIGEWRAVDLTGSAAFIETWSHKLFDDALEVEVQVSQASDGSTPVESLALTGITDSLAIANTLQLSSGAQSLTGSVALTGAHIVNHSAKAKWTKTSITVSNVSPNLLYKDFDGVDQQAGFVRVVVKKLRK